MGASTTRLKEPSILRAAGNCRRMVHNLRYVLDSQAVDKLEAEIDRNVVALFSLGDSHLAFAKTIDTSQWRQRISRLYYAAYNIRRAVSLHHAGHFATDSSDHKNVGDLPDDFPNANTVEVKLQGLRDDRNLADYNHLAEESELIVSPADVEIFVGEFRTTCLDYLTQRGLAI